MGNTDAINEQFNRDIVSEINDPLLEPVFMKREPFQTQQTGSGKRGTVYFKRLLFEKLKFSNNSMAAIAARFPARFYGAFVFQAGEAGWNLGKGFGVISNKNTDT